MKAQSNSKLANQIKEDVTQLFIPIFGEIKSRLDHQGNSILEIKGDIANLTTKVTGLDTKVTGLDTKVTGLDTKVTGLDAKVTGLDAKVTGLDTKVTGLDAKVTGLDTKVTGLDAKVTGLDAKVTGLDARFTVLESDNKNIKMEVRKTGIIVEQMNSRLDLALDMSALVAGHIVQIKDHEERLETIETKVESVTKILLPSKP